MSEQLAPALTADEWQDGAAVVTMRAGTMFGPQRPALVRVGVTAESLTFHPDAGQATEQAVGVVLMALGNASLPSDSQYKITRDDVIAISVLLHGGEFARVTSDVQHPRNAALDRVIRLREKLAALLPPV